MSETILRRGLLAPLFVAGLSAAAVAQQGAKLQGFPTADAAAAALTEAIRRNDDKAIRAIVGEGWLDFLIDEKDDPDRERAAFLAAWDAKHAVVADGNKAVVAVGSDGWTLPIPIVKAAKGWQFDTLGGAHEMRIRRVGRNERSAMQTMLAIRDAQLEYATTDHDGDGVLAYASFLKSSPGKQDGLYWPTRPGETPSPLGAGIAAAGAGKGASGYHGYRYRLLTAQGPHAPGGAMNYIVRGKLFGGFAILAWPVRYGDTGVMSFMVNHDGQIYERDLGADTGAKTVAMKSFDPAPGWTKVEP